MFRRRLRSTREAGLFIVWAILFLTRTFTRKLWAVWLRGFLLRTKKSSVWNRSKLKLTRPFSQLMNFNKLPQDREKARDVSVKEMPEDFDIADLSKIKNFGGSSVVYKLCEGYVAKENISVVAKKILKAEK